jgi:hypothetical protein
MGTSTSMKATTSLLPNCEIKKAVPSKYSYVSNLNSRSNFERQNLTRITGLLSYKTQHFGTWTCFRLQVRGGRYLLFWVPGLTVNSTYIFHLSKILFSSSASLFSTNIFSVLHFLPFTFLFLYFLLHILLCFVSSSFFFRFSINLSFTTYIR